MTQIPIEGSNSRHDAEFNENKSIISTYIYILWKHYTTSYQHKQAMAISYFSIYLFFLNHVATSSLSFDPYTAFMN